MTIPANWRERIWQDLVNQHPPEVALRLLQQVRREGTLTAPAANLRRLDAFIKDLEEQIKRRN